MSREINFEYQQFLNKFYGVDKLSLKTWIDKKFAEYFYRSLDEISIDKDMAIPRDSTQKELIEDSVCSICLGIVRLPGKMCNNCSKLFCELCIEKIGGHNGYGGQVVNNQVFDITCPCCKVKTKKSNLNFPIFMKNQIVNFEFKCKKKNCRGKRLPEEENKFALNNVNNVEKKP